MSNKKHIDRLFQEKFKDFEVQPDAKVWQNIEKQLESNSATPKVIPLWLKISAIASVLIIGLTAGLLIKSSQNNESTNNSIVNNNAKSNATTETSEFNTSSNTSNKNSTKNELNFKYTNTANPTNKVENHTNTEAVVNTNNTSTKKGTTTNSIENNLNRFANNKTQNSAHKNNSNVSINNTSTNTINKNSDNYSLAGNEKNNSKNNSKNNQKSTSNNTYNTNKQQIVNSYKVGQSGQKHLNNNAQNHYANQVTSTNKNQSTASVKTIKNTSSKQNSSNYYSSNNTNSSLQNSQETKARTNSILDTEKLSLAIIKDSLASQDLITIDDKGIERAIEDYDKLIKKEQIGNRWAITPNIAPVYYNSMGKGSQFGSQFTNNKKSGETNTSYGLNVGYALTKNITIRSGINKLNLSYDTDDVIVFESISDTPTKPLENIDFYTLPNRQGLSVISTDNLAVQQVSRNLDYNAALSQRINYLEFPLEIEYKLNKSRFGLNIIGGFSTFVLENNKVVSEFDGFKTEVGEANNINNLSFSANLGLGINYKFTKQFVYNLEPTFKYQVNGFSNTYGKFNPYIIGVYTGFSYKF